MFFRDRQELSLAPKSLVLGTIWVATLAAWWMMFPASGFVPEWFRPYVLSGDPTRSAIVLICLAVYAVRVTVTILIFLKRKYLWTEAVIVTSAMPYIVVLFAQQGGANSLPPGLIEIAGLALYVAGSFLNTWSEYQRRRFKSDPVNQGRLYSNGLFGASRNVNYFGDVVLFLGLALVTGRAVTLLIPLFMALIFDLILIPLKDAYLAKKYGAQFDDYKKQNKRLIPYVY